MSEVSPADDTVKGGSASWNVDTLLRYFENSAKMREQAVEAAFAGRDKAVEAAFVAQEKAVAAALAAQKEAVNKAESASEKRFESVNEFRAQLADQNKTFATRNDLDNLKEQMNKLENTQSRGLGSLDGHSSSSDTLMRVLPIIISLAVLLFIVLTFASGRQ